MEMLSFPALWPAGSGQQAVCPTAPHTSWLGIVGFPMSAHLPTPCSSEHHVAHSRAVCHRLIEDFLTIPGDTLRIHGTLAKLSELPMATRAQQEQGTEQVTSVETLRKQDGYCLPRRRRRETL